MENKIDTKLDYLLKEVGKDSIPEKPSVDFTANVMQQLQKETFFTTTTQYQPLISKKIGWLIFSAVALGLLFFGYNSTETSSWLPEIEFNTINVAPLLEQLGQFDVSNTFVYAFSFLGIMLLIQITWLKKNHDKKWQG